MTPEQSVKSYVAVLAALVVLTFATVAFSFLPLPERLACRFGNAGGGDQGVIGRAVFHARDS